MGILKPISFSGTKTLIKQPKEPKTKNSPKANILAVTEFLG
jgi:hypothetical protein